MGKRPQHNDAAWLSPAVALCRRLTHVLYICYYHMYNT